MALPTASDNVFPKVILGEAAAPATPSAGEVKLYAKTDGLLYSKDDAGTETLVSGGAGGGAGAGWTLAVDESGASFANFTGLSGTWASDGAIIQQTATGASARRAKYNNRVDTANMIIEVECRFPTGGSAARTASILLGWPGTDVANYPFVALYEGAAPDRLVLGRDALTEAVAITQTLALDTWYKVTARCAGGSVSAWLDGVFVAAARLHAPASNTDYDSSYVGFKSFDGGVDFRNFKVWTLTLPS